MLLSPGSVVGRAPPRRPPRAGLALSQSASVAAAALSRPRPSRALHAAPTHSRPTLPCTRAHSAQRQPFRHALADGDESAHGSRRGPLSFRCVRPHGQRLKTSLAPPPTHSRVWIAPLLSSLAETHKHDTDTGTHGERDDGPNRRRRPPCLTPRHAYDLRSPRLPLPLITAPWCTCLLCGAGSDRPAPPLPASHPHDHPRHRRYSDVSLTQTQHAHTQSHGRPRSAPPPPPAQEYRRGARAPARARLSGAPPPPPPRLLHLPPPLHPSLAPAPLSRAGRPGGWVAGGAVGGRLRGGRSMTPRRAPSACPTWSACSRGSAGSARAPCRGAPGGSVPIRGSRRWPLAESSRRAGTS